MTWAALLAALAPAVARAQEFVKVEGAAREELPAGRSWPPPTRSSGSRCWRTWWSWPAALARVRKDADELRAKVDQASRTGGPAPRA